MSGQQKPIGQAWLRNELRLPVPEPAIESYVVAGSRRTESSGDHTREYYPSHYAINDSVVFIFGSRYVTKRSIYAY